MTIASVRALLYAAVSGVSGLSNVYDYQRAPVGAQRKRFVELFRVSGTERVTFLTIEFGGVPSSTVLNEFEGSDNYLDVTQTRNETWILRFYYGWHDTDATEKAAANLVEDIMEAIDNYDQLHVSEYSDYDNYIYAQPATCPIFELREVGGWAMHYAQIQVTVEEETV